MTDMDLWEQWFNGNVNVGTVLVAAPGVEKPAIKESVVLLIEHDEIGWTGLILNKQKTRNTETLIRHDGGPDLAFEMDFVDPASKEVTQVKGGHHFVVRKSQVPLPPPATEIFNGLYVQPARLADALEIAEKDEKCKIYVGCVMWSNEQLKAEVGLHVWEISPNIKGNKVVFTNSQKMERLWQTLFTKVNTNRPDMLMGLKPAQAQKCIC